MLQRPRTWLLYGDTIHGRCNIRIILRDTDMKRKLHDSNILLQFGESPTGVSIRQTVTTC